MFITSKSLSKILLVFLFLGVSLRADFLNFKNGNWKDLPQHKFIHKQFSTFHRLQTNFDNSYSRCQHNVNLVPGKPVRITVKLLAYSEVSRSLVRIGLKSKDFGNWAFSIGTAMGPFDDTGWQIMSNAADPYAERTPLAGFDNCDWHKFTLIITGPNTPVKLYCDGQYVMNLTIPIGEQQRQLLLKKEAKIGGHTSTRYPVPSTAGNIDYVFIESSLAGQIIDIDYVEISQKPLVTSRTSLPVLLDLDWSLDSLTIVENNMVPYEGNPILKKQDISYLFGKNDKEEIVWPYVIQDGNQFGMYFCGPLKDSNDPVKPAVGIYHAISKDGINWKVTPERPVIKNDNPDDADFYCTPPVVLKEKNIYRMWYGAYPRGVGQGRVAYAESKDGVNWVKPKLGLHKYNGINSNICVSLLPEPHLNEYRLPRDIVFDDTLSKSNRYFLIMHAQGPVGFVIDAATSSDGIHFTHAPNNARYYGLDASPRPRTLHGAPYILHESNYWWTIVGFGEQGSKAGYVANFVGWATEPEEKDNISFGLWRPRKLSKQRSDNNGIDLGRILAVGNEWWLYYVGKDSFNLAKIGKHRLYGIKLLSDKETGFAETIGLKCPAKSWKKFCFAINASELSANSFVQAQLINVDTGQPIEPYTFENSVPLANDGFEVTLRWQSVDSQLPENNFPLAIRLKLNRGTSDPQIHAVYVKNKE